MSNTLEERLRSNSNAFEGLLALIPAKYYYDDKTQEQWKAKKKSKSQAREDKVKKLDPDQMDDETLSSLEVMKKRENNAKPVSLPGEKFKLKEAAAAIEGAGESSTPERDSAEEDGKIGVIFDDEGNEVAPEAPAGEEPQKDAKKQPEGGSKKNLDALRSKLQAKIQELKEKRKAPGTKVKGAPSSREAILAERKRKLENKNRRQRQQQDEEEPNGSDNSDSDDDGDSDNQMDGESDRKRHKAADDNIASQVMFQNIIFDDGDAVASNLQNLRRTAKKKGPANNDVRAHLKLVEAKKQKLESKDELEQIKLKEKSKWQRATLQAEGVKLKDDEKLLRKALKRKEAKKRKSALEWKERQKSVASTIAEKQKRREENLKIRRENKGVKRSKQQKMKRKFTGTAGSKKRAGFEGRLKSGKKK
ncbi:hypothetical protein HG536_0G00490 [Torulaspora globosa]|uniref:Ribosomal RNA-processing protein 14/surfeit locus protein 6 C-terminal domain-containing protein n=1 Tax=Torulaspora globosa TaxID=48254 RepID=A0A7G3ZL06_9SACH|nr:uncharacterized protein HG536_0G00490 [Torulaspora globosa]QLL34192.1 hypothetical protein HG536_0G00490 [Torulaspora globosa]